MSIGAVGYGALATRRAGDTFRALKDDLAGLQAQLATGKTADGYAGLGSAAGTSLSGRARLAALDGHAANIADATLRATLMGEGAGQLDRLAAGLAGLSGTLPSTPLGRTSAQVSAADGLRQALDILNGEVGGRYLFAGRGSDGPPVLGYDAVMDGQGSLAGLRQLVAERRQADAGTDGLGRLQLSAAGSTVTLSEEAPGSPYGFKLAGATATGTGLGATRASGPPPSVTVTVGGQPSPGDAVTLLLGLPDGGTAELVLVAGTDFAIGADPDATAMSLRAALGSALSDQAATKLAAASAAATATDFFSASAARPPSRVAGPPLASATSLVPGTATDTVIWYRGEDGSGSARETAPVRIGEGQTVALGARANEPALRGLLAGLGALAAEEVTAGDPAAAGRYAALAGRVSTLSGGGGPSTLTTDLALAASALATASERIGVARNQVEDVLAGAEDADPNAVAMKLLAAQTRLQASYQTTAQIARMSLVDFI